MLALRLVSCISPQASRTFVPWPECLESIISFILNTFSCSSRQPTSSNRFVGSSLSDQTMTAFYSDLCCAWLCLLECVSWCHLWNPFWLHSLFPSYCLWSFSLLLFSKVFKKYGNFNGIFMKGGGPGGERSHVPFMFFSKMFCCKCFKKHESFPDCQNVFCT